jgi:type I restriction enzyme R subunit
LKHFDAVKIGLMATPALYTVSIFGDPVYKYSYREAVIDGWLIDHEPPIQITTALSKAGIRFKKGEQVELVDTRTGKIDLTHTPDEIKFEVDEFNKAVVTVPFNKTVAEELARRIDPNLPGKTLVFAVSDAHADIVVEELKKAFAAAYGEVEDEAIKKITGSVDRPGRQILSFRNDALPKIAVTVDLLTTGIDVPSIQNLVFLRRVNSRILYEQMLGRATRQCPEIGKETFRIFDAVDLYPNLQNLTEMKPVVVDPNISLEQLFAEFAQLKDEKHREAVRDQILVKMRRRIKRLHEDARARYETEVGETPEATLKRLTEQGDWIPGVVHAPSLKGSLAEKNNVTQLYREHGLRVHTARMGEEPGFYHLLQLLKAQKLKVFSSLNGFLSEYRTVDESALLLQCCYVLLASGHQCMRPKVAPQLVDSRSSVHWGERDWMA